MAVARSRSDVAGGGDERCSSHDDAPHGVDARCRREDGPQAAGHVRQGCEWDVSRRIAEGPDRHVLCRKSTVFASTDGTGPKGTIASECPKSPHCKKSSGTGIWRESSAWAHAVRKASSSTCTVLNTPRSDREPRMRRHDAARMDSRRTLSLSK